MRSSSNIEVNATPAPTAGEPIPLSTAPWTQRLPAQLPAGMAQNPAEQEKWTPSSKHHAALPPWPFWALLVGLLLLWHVVGVLGLLNEKLLPRLDAVLKAGYEALLSGKLWQDLSATTLRVVGAYSAAVAVALPLGLALGHGRWLRAALLPGVHFVRSMSPLAWTPFVLLWFGKGDFAASVLIFMAVVFQLTVATCGSVASIPQVFFRLAEDHQLRGLELWRTVTLPAILPALLTGLRIAAGMAWLVMVAAELVAGEHGLGVAVQAARTTQRTELLVVNMVLIGSMGVVTDALLMRLTHLPSMRWGYEH